MRTRQQELPGKSSRVSIRSELRIVSGIPSNLVHAACMHRFQLIAAVTDAADTQQHSWKRCMHTSRLHDRLHNPIMITSVYSNPVTSSYTQHTAAPTQGSVRDSARDSALGLSTVSHLLTSYDHSLQCHPALVPTRSTPIFCVHQTPQ